MKDNRERYRYNRKRSEEPEDESCGADRKRKADRKQYPPGIRPAWIAAAGIAIALILFRAVPLYAGGGETDDIAESSKQSGAQARYGGEEQNPGIKEYQPAPDVAVHSEELSYADKCGLDYVERPRKRTLEEIVQKLEILAEDSEVIAKILENSSLYSEKLLGALANNPEMADFVAGYPSAKKRASGGYTEAEKSQDFPLFLQWDPRWGYVEYGDESIVGLAGCGPVCLAMAIFYLTGDETVTPDKIAEYSMENGYYVSGVGTAWLLIEDVPALNGIQVSKLPVSEETMKTVLDYGDIIICSMRPGDFTAIGHFVVIYGYDEDGFLINDPNCVARSRERWPFFRIEKQINNMWALER